MTPDELRDKLRLAKTPGERRALLEEYRKEMLNKITMRQRYSEMNRFIRALSRIGRGK